RFGSHQTVTELLDLGVLHSSAIDEFNSIGKDLDDLDARRKLLLVIDRIGIGLAALPSSYYGSRGPLVGSRANRKSTNKLNGKSGFYRRRIEIELGGLRCSQDYLRRCLLRVKDIAVEDHLEVVETHLRLCLSYGGADPAHL